MGSILKVGRTFHKGAITPFLIGPQYFWIVICDHVYISLIYEFGMLIRYAKVTENNGGHIYKDIVSGERLQSK